MVLSHKDSVSLLALKIITYIHVLFFFFFFFLCVCLRLVRLNANYLPLIKKEDMIENEPPVCRLHSWITLKMIITV